MGYIESIEEFFEKNTKIKFNNSIENSIFYLVEKILNDEIDGSNFIMIPMRELGFDNYAENYASFCGTIAFAAGKHVYEINKQTNILPEIFDYDYFLDRNNIYIKRGKYKIPFDDYGTRNEYNTVKEIKSLNYPKLLPPKLFIYNNKNGYRNIVLYKQWVNKFDQDSFILNNPTKKILVFSHSEIDNSEWLNYIPHCKVDSSGNEQYSSPIEPLIYLANEESKKLSELVRNKTFETIIFIGDHKFMTGGDWSLRHKYFKKLIYIGAVQPDKTSLYYTFSPLEIYKSYKIKENEFKEEYIQFSKVDVEINTNLNQAFGKFKEKVKEIQTNGGEFKFSLLGLINRASPIDSELKAKMEDWFDDYLINNLTYENDGTIEELSESYSEILKQLETGDIKKIDELKKIINQVPIDKKIVLTFIVSQKDEIKYLSKALRIQSDNFITLKGFIRKFDAIRNKKSFKNAYKNKFIFLAYDNTYNEILKMMDSYSLLGERIFIGIADNRFKNILNNRNNLLKSLFETECRKNITSVDYKEIKLTDSVNFGDNLLSIDDFTYDDAFEFTYQTDSNIENYQITLEDGESVILNGTVVVEDEIVDVADLKKGDFFTYYQNSHHLFEQVWRIYAPQIAFEIDTYSLIWKQTLRELKEYYKTESNLLKALQGYNWKTEISTLKAYLRENNNTQFPRTGSLNSIKKLCDNLENFQNNTFVEKYNEIRRSQKALSLKIKLGRILSKALFDDKLGLIKEDPIKALLGNTNLFDQIKEDCLKSATVSEIKKVKA
jgi:hypothetical protein